MINTEVVDAQDPNEVLYSFEASSMPRRGDVLWHRDESREVQRCEWVIGDGGLSGVIVHTRLLPLDISPCQE
ncbi:gp106 [Mycobacterium phage Corndog]|uniref:Uncharacterized protein n=5 Tax=Corndogvirus TaxID=1623285 RepID=Q856I8_BPMCO|nr:gp106 [Mycobacterium phage Corndog]YP_008530668.1 hypothetical protein PBI_DYLAN_104 [Mycobacterium phage Dylan]YP_009014472.1 hypothetical protein CL96_gp109 [Mycobacterium phage Firecracker]AII28346.1 hypothetical protein PBI_YUNGJAMAL_107 [Mycobacterium phage YungJamal]QFP96599.1 hypothetical protein SEA_SMOOCH_108 [Mycobacterium phage Smooch]WUT94755.1 hypothetical protein SUAREZ_107 [Mycobacterium phage Suarez]AAN02038.1 hypothetical protein PBI_CORNDOG_106 [Mycobacterium phage Corndo